MSRAIDEPRLTASVRDVLHHRPVAGLVVGVVQDGSLAWLHAHGFADVAPGRPVDADTVFRRLGHEDDDRDRGPSAVGTGSGRPRPAVMPRER